MFCLLFLRFFIKIPSELGKIRKSSKLAWWCSTYSKVIIISDKARVIEINEKEIERI